MRYVLAFGRHGPAFGRLSILAAYLYYIRDVCFTIEQKGSQITEMGMFGSIEQDKTEDVMVFLVSFVCYLGHTRSDKQFRTTGNV